jgi:hypothetical protein
MAAIVVLAGAAGGSIYDGNSPLGTPLTLFIAQLVIICTLARVLTKLFAYIKRNLRPHSFLFIITLNLISRFRSSPILFFSWY